MTYSPIQICKGTFSSDLTTLFTASTSSTGVMVQTVTVTNQSTNDLQALVKLDGIPVLPWFTVPANDGVTNTFDKGWHFLPSGGLLQGQSTASSTNLSYLISGLQVNT